jgi:hypothetical protein
VLLSAESGDSFFFLLIVCGPTGDAASFSVNAPHIAGVLLLLLLLLPPHLIHTDSRMKNTSRVRRIQVCLNM